MQLKGKTVVVKNLQRLDWKFKKKKIKIKIFLTQGSC